MTGTTDLRVGKAPLVTRDPTSRSSIFNRPNLRRTLGVLWLLDAALQLQSFMFTKGFAHQVIAPAAIGQPLFVADPVRWNSKMIALHPALCNGLFVAIQLALGVGLLVTPLVRWALIGSMAWAGGVWYLGEGLGGLAGGHVTALVGAPGAALLYIVVALAAWPSTTATTASTDQTPPARWIVPVWAGLWLGFAALELLHANGSPGRVGAELTTNAFTVPSWLGGFDRWTASGVHTLGNGTTALLVAAELAIGLLALSRGIGRSAAIWGGIALAALYWAAGQSFGQLLGGHATDPSTGPLLMLVGATALASRPAVAMGERTVRTRPSPIPRSIRPGGSDPSKEIVNQHKATFGPVFARLPNETESGVHHSWAHRCYNRLGSLGRDDDRCTERLGSAAGGPEAASTRYL